MGTLYQKWYNPKILILFCQAVLKMWPGVRTYLDPSFHSWKIRLALAIASGSPALHAAPRIVLRKYLM